MDNKTIVQQSKNKKCICTLNSLKLNTTMLAENLEIDSKVYYSLVFLTPTNQSRYGTKFKKLHKFNKRVSDKFLREIFEKLGISNDSVLVFDTFNGKKGKSIEVKDVKEILSNGPFILLKNECGIVNSLYASIRNCLAHGDIIKDAEWYYLFALSSRNIKISDEDKKLKFILKIKSLDQLSVLCAALDEFK